MGRVFLSCILLPCFRLAAMLVGDPAQPALEKCGLIFQKPYSVSFRAGYVDDWVYEQKFQESSEDSNIIRALFKISTYAGQLTFNFAHRLDLYGLVGSSRLQIDEEIFTKRALSWGTGAKLIILKSGNFYLGTDFKYFETRQKPRYFVIEGLPYNVVNLYYLHYQEVQAALGIAYQISFFVPYINVTYLKATMEPIPRVVLVRIPDMNEKADFPTARMRGENNWGMALGLSLIDNKRFSFGLEWRTFNQSALDWNFDFRF